MSTYKAITLHPLTGMPELATWHDDYYGQHEYGVEFPSDKKVFPAGRCSRRDTPLTLTPEEAGNIIQHLFDSLETKI